MRSIFSPLSAAFFGLLFGVEARRYRVMPIHLDILWSYTSCLRARVRNNNHNNHNNLINHRLIGAMMRSLCSLPGGLGRFYPALFILIIAGFVMLVGRGVVNVLLLDLEKVPLSFF